MCSAPKQGLTLPASVDLEKETVITGRVIDGAGQTVGGRSCACWTPPTSSPPRSSHRPPVTSGSSPPGDLDAACAVPSGNGDASVAPSGAGIHEVDVKVA